MLAAIALSIAVLGGGLYLGLHDAAGGQPAGAATSPAGNQSSASAGASHGNPSASPSSSHPVGQAGDYPVAQARFTFYELSPVAGRRVLRTTVWFPETGAGNGTADGPFPLIVFAPGFMQCGSDYSALLRQWASAGYVVGAVNFPRTNCYVAGPDEKDLVNQPADMAYVTVRLRELSQSPGNRLSGLISPNRVAFAGHSDGGDTVAAMAADSCCRYGLLRAVVVLAGAEYPALGGSWFSQPTPPMLFVQGSADTCNPPTDSMYMYQSDTTGTRFYLDLFGANHLTPYEGTSEPEPIVEQVTIDFFDRYLAGQNIAPGAMRRAARVQGLAALSSGGSLPPGQGGGRGSGNTGC